MTDKAHLSAIVVCYNEAELLPRCLKSLGFCSEILVIDLGSTDDSALVAQQMGATVMAHPWVPIGEMARWAGITRARFDWTFRIDPDEEVSPKLALDITQLIEDDDGDAGVIAVPWRNYFKERPLKGTVWGGNERSKRVLIHRQRTEPVVRVHLNFSLKDGHIIRHILPSEENVLDHYWFRSWRAHWEKHRRYVLFEGEAKYANGERYRTRQLMTVVPAKFWESFIVNKGYLDGRTGLSLSLFWVWYNFASLLSLRKYEQEESRHFTQQVGLQDFSRLAE